MVALSTLTIGTAMAAPTIWTQHNDNSRTGANTAETALTPANVSPSTFGKLYTVNLDDESYSQPLYVPGVVIGGVAHNVVYVTSVNNSVYAIDADSGAQLWTVNLSNGGTVPNIGNMSALGACGGNYADFAGKFGIVGTPVISTTTNSIYVIARTIDGGTYNQRLHMLSLATGGEQAGSPVVISGTGNGVNFDPVYNNQRTALALVNGVVYAGWSSHCDNGPYHGFIIGFNANTLARVAAWSATASNGGQAGIWQGGQGVTADGSNNLYLMTGNGSWDGVNNFGESAVKLSTATGLNLTDFFTPNNWGSLNGADADLGSAGLLGIPGTTYVFGGGKQGMVYLLNTANMGHENGTDQVVQEFQATFPSGGNSGHIHGGPVYYNTGSAQYVYLWGENDFLRAYQFNGTNFNTSAVAVSTMRAPVSNSGMPGGFLSLSSNGASNGIVWALTPYNANANNATVQGILHAFNAVPSGGALTELWNSKQNAARDDFGNYAKFTYPTVANGKVYIVTFGNASAGQGTLVAYGPVSAPVEAPYGGTAWAIPGTIQAENYDTGGEGIAYHDTDVINNGGQYRPNEGVDIEACTDTGGGFNVGWTNTGEYLKYMVNVASSATYTVAIRVASGSTGGTFHIENESGTNLSGTISVGGTGGWQTWITANANVALTSGAHTLKIVFDNAAGSINVNSLTFTGGGTLPSAPSNLQATGTSGQVALSWTNGSGSTSVNVYRGTASGGESATPIATNQTGTTYNDTAVTNGTTYWYKVKAVNASGSSGYSNEASATPQAGAEAPYLGTAWAVPGTVQSENYDTGGESVAYHDSDTVNSGGAYRTDGVDVEACTDTGGGYNVGYTNAGEYMKYTVNVATAGTYTVTFRVANGTTGNGSFHLQNAGGTNLSGAVTVVPSGGWQTWASVTANVTLPAGLQILTLFEDTANFNINYMTFATSGGTLPGAPSNLGATGSNTKVALTWTAGSGSTGTNIYRGTAQGAEGTTPIASNQAGTSYNDTAVTNGTTYWYKVKSVNSTGTSGFSNEVSATPQGTTGEAPYLGTPWAIPGTVQSENFDTGGEGVAYHDNEAANQGGQYRTTEGVDIEACTDTGGGYNVGWTNAGEYMKYTVNVATAGTYTVTFRVANGNAANGSFHLQNAAGTNLSGAVTVAPTGGWQTWASVTANVTLPAGQQILTLFEDAANFNVNSMAFAAAAGGQPDLIVTSIGWTPASPASGNQVVFNCVIKNQGTGATPAGVIHGVQFAVDGSTTTNWSDNDTASLAAGASITLTATGGVNGVNYWPATSGAHSVQAWVDDVNRIAESNENNNKLTANLTVP